MQLQLVLLIQKVWWLTCIGFIFNVKMLLHAEHQFILLANHSETRIYSKCYRPKLNSGNNRKSYEYWVKAKHKKFQEYFWLNYISNYSVCYHQTNMGEHTIGVPNIAFSLFFNRLFFPSLMYVVHNCATMLQMNLAH